MDAFFLKMFVKANEIKVFEHSVRTRKSHCYGELVIQFWHL